MDTRSFLVPTTAALSLAVTTGCGPAIVGTWDLTSTTYAGETQAVPITQSGTYDGQTYEIVFDASLTVDKDLSASFDSTYSYTIGDAEPQVETYSYALTATKVSGKEYTIEANEEGGLDMSCTIAGKDMDCTSGGEAPTRFTFERGSKAN